MYTPTFTEIQPVANQRTSRIIERTRATEERQPVKLDELVTMMETVEWHTADSVSYMFECRYRNTDGGIMDTITEAHIINFRGQGRIEMTSRFGETITVYYEDDKWIGYDAYLAETYTTAS